MNIGCQDMNYKCLKIINNSGSCIKSYEEFLESARTALLFRVSEIFFNQII